MDFFSYNNRTGQLEIDDYNIMLVKEFNELYSNERNKCKEDKKGTSKILATKELTYMWLKINKKSPYSQYSEKDAHIQAMKDSGLTQEEYDDEIFRNACRKYTEIRDSNRISKMIRAVYNKIDEVTVYFEEIVDFNERDQTGKPVFKVKEFQAEIKNLADLINGVKQLELLYDKDIEASSSLRSDAIPGYRN